MSQSEPPPLSLGIVLVWQNSPKRGNVTALLTTLPDPSGRPRLPMTSWQAGNSLKARTSLPLVAPWLPTQIPEWGKTPISSIPPMVSLRVKSSFEVLHIGVAAVRALGSFRIVIGWFEETGVFLTATGDGGVATTRQLEHTSDTGPEPAPAIVSKCFFLLINLENLQGNRLGCTATLSGWEQLLLPCFILCSNSYIGFIFNGNHNNKSFPKRLKYLRCNVAHYHYTLIS